MNRVGEARQYQQAGLGAVEIADRMGVTRQQVYRLLNGVTSGKATKRECRYCSQMALEVGCCQDCGRLA